MRAGLDDRPFAVVDVGSNSARMIVSDPVPASTSTCWRTRGAPCGSAGAWMPIRNEAIDRTLEALRDFARRRRRRPERMIVARRPSGKADVHFLLGAPGTWACRWR